MTGQANKRERLIDSADRLIHRKGFGQTTLADIAHESGIPLGNVYYYFKTKEEIGSSVIEKRLTVYRGLLELCATQPGPRERLKAFLQLTMRHCEMLVKNGCPVGTLCYEMSHQPERTQLHEQSKALVQLIVDWSEAQFRELDPGNSRPLALQFVSQLQGMSLISNAMEDAEVVRSMLKRIHDWLDSIQ